MLGITIGWVLHFRLVMISCFRVSALSSGTSIARTKLHTAGCLLCFSLSISAQKQWSTLPG